jgi:DNA adenine methylase
VHIINFYNDIKAGLVTPGTTREFLTREAEKLLAREDEYYYEVRERFNKKPTSLDFLFLNRACFNGVMRFNRHGRFNVPFCHKTERFAPAYITKIVNQVQAVRDTLQALDWEFRIADFRGTLSDVGVGDFVYADPPYAGRHVDYFNSWSEDDETDLANMLAELRCRFALSTWHSNEFRSNPLIDVNWAAERFCMYTREHYYHVGSTEDLRHPMIEAVVTNFQATYSSPLKLDSQPALVLFERRPSYLSSGNLEAAVPLAEVPA